MKALTLSSLLGLVAAGAISAASVAADQWTGPKEVAKASREFAVAGKILQKAVRNVAEDSPLVRDLGRISETADQLGESVAKGATYEDASRDFRKLQQGYEAFEGALKKDHDVHHDDAVVRDAKKLKEAYDSLGSHMTGRRPDR